eukprot:COSAG05_NODE_1240_length_5422_cov_6.791283_4_plen_173_part_00
MTACLCLPRVMPQTLTRGQTNEWKAPEDEKPPEAQTVTEELGSDGRFQVPEDACIRARPLVLFCDMCPSEIALLDGPSICMGNPNGLSKRPPIHHLAFFWTGIEYLGGGVALVSSRDGRPCPRTRRAGSRLLLLTAAAATWPMLVSPSPVPPVLTSVLDAPRICAERPSGIC